LMTLEIQRGRCNFLRLLTGGRGEPQRHRSWAITENEEVLARD